MPLYVYETIPQNDGDRPEQFEIKQSIQDEPLTRHPETGVPIRKVVTAGAILGSGGSAEPPGCTGEPGGGCPLCN